MRRLKTFADIKDFRVTSIEHLSGGEVLSREKIAADGTSSGQVAVPHSYQPDPAAMFAACHCGKGEHHEIHQGKGALQTGNREA